MTQEILLQEGAIEVGALVLARGLGLDVASLHEFMREGKITNLRERGVDNDLALHRPTFFNGNRRLRRESENDKDYPSSEGHVSIWFSLGVRLVEEATANLLAPPLGDHVFFLRPQQGLSGDW